MTRMWISIILFISTLGLCGYELFTIKDISEKSEEKISQMQQYVLENSPEKALEISENLTQEWEKNNTLLSIFIQHEPLENIDQSLSLINISLKRNQISEFWIESSRVAIQITKLSDTDIPYIGNIL